MALCFEPSRFFLNGKVTQKQTSYKHKHTVREEVSQVWNEHKRRRYKKQSQVLVLGPDKRRLNVNRSGYQEFLAGGRDYEISEKQWVRKGV